MQLILNDKILYSERNLKQAIYFMEYARKDINMSFLLYCTQLNLISYWSRHSFIKKVPLFKKDFLQVLQMPNHPAPDENKLEELLMQLDTYGYIRYTPSLAPDKPAHFTMITLLKIRAYPQIVWKGNTYRGIKSLKKGMQLNAPLAVDKQGLRIADSISQSPFSPTLSQIKDLFLQNNYPLKEAVEFFRHYQYNDWLYKGKIMYNPERAMRVWMKNIKDHAAHDQLKT